MSKNVKQRRGEAEIRTQIAEGLDTDLQDFQDADIVITPNRVRQSDNRLIP
jgi:hypothetical protein